MTREDKEKITRDFIQQIEQQFIEFTVKTGIDFTILSKEEYKHLENHPIGFKKLTEAMYFTLNNGLNLYYCPRDKKTRDLILDVSNAHL